MSNVFLFFAIGIGLLSFLIEVFTSWYHIDYFPHLHNSWLIYKDYIPYKDFFEIHNPGLWYFLSPLFFFLKDNPVILPISRFINVLIFSAAVFVLYKINRIFKISKIVFWLNLLVFLNFDFLRNMVLELRPDYLMLLFSVFAYYLVLFGAREKKVLFFGVAGFFQFLALFVSQKAIPFYLVAILFLLIELLRANDKKQKSLIINGLVVFLVINLLLFGLATLFLTQQKMLADYIQQNFGIVKFMVPVIETFYPFDRLKLPDYILLPSLVLSVGYFLFFKVRRYYFYILPIIIYSLALIAIGKNLFIYWYAVIFLFSVNFLSILISKKQYLLLPLLIFFTINGIYFIPKSLNKMNFDQLKAVGFILRNTDQAEKWFSIEWIHPIYRPDIPNVYYSWTCEDHAMYLLNKGERMPDLNRLLSIYKPKFICYRDTFLDKEVGEAVARDYAKTDFYCLYQRKQ